MGEKTKICTKCGRKFPATTEFFHRCRSNRDGFKYKCKACRNEHARELGAVGRVVPKDLPGEEWRPAVGFDGWYEASNLGRMRRSRYGHHTFAGKILKPSINPGGYKIIGLSMNSEYSYHSVHSLVAKTFIGPYPECKEINHIDGDKTNNNVENLEYVTKSENQLHALKMGLSIPLRGESHNMAKLTKEDILEILRLLKNGDLFQWEIADMYGVCQSTISLINTGETWQCLND